MFVTGQKVVCIDDKAPITVMALYAQWIVEGRTYTIRALASGTAPVEMGKTDEIRVLLMEVRNPSNSKGEERGFRIERFRPLQELTEEDIRKQTEGEQVERLEPQLV